MRGRAIYRRYIALSSNLPACLMLIVLLFGCKDKAEAEVLKEQIALQEGSPIEQIHTWGWGKIPKQNFCPHCGELSYTRFCTNCKKERGNLPFIGVYCPKCDPTGRHASKTADVTEICGDCGSKKAWKYVYEDWQTEPNEPNDKDDN